MPSNFSSNLKQWNWGLWAGLFLFAYFLIFPVDSSLDLPARRMFTVVILMAVWWMTEAIPLGITALLPLVLYPFLNIMRTAEVAPNYTHHLVFLFMGGFFIAIALQKWKLHIRFALKTIYYMGRGMRILILAFMLVSALLSMWISNTATAILIMPIGLGVIQELEKHKKLKGSSLHKFRMVLMLGIAYSTSIGGLATLIGTPPNLIFSGVYKKFFPDQPEITFARWMIYIFPLSAILLTFVYFYLTRILLRRKDIFEFEGKSFLKDEIKRLGKLNAAQIRVLIIFCLTAFLWIFRSKIQIGTFVIPGWTSWLGLENLVQDSTIAIGMSVLLFLIPAGVGDKGLNNRLLQAKEIMKIPWDILLLFGGGFALAEGFAITGLADYIAGQLNFITHLPLFFLIFSLALLVSFLTEFTSNTAVATTILPVVAALTPPAGMSPLMLMVPATLAASCAFMLPVATPPNAIVFGTRLISIQQMIKAGFLLNISTALIIAAYFAIFFS